MNILAVTRVYYGPGSNGTQGEQRNENPGSKHEKMKRLASGSVHKYTGKVKELVGNAPFHVTPDHVYIYYHNEHTTPTHDYFSIVWIDK